MKKVSLILLCITTSLSACVKDYGRSDGNEVSGKNYIQLSLNSQKEVVTRSEASDNECAIDNIYLLVFDGVTDKYKSGEKVESGNITGTDKSKPRIITAMTISDGDKVVVVCNAGNSSLPVFAATDTESKINELFTFPAHTAYNQSDKAESGKRLPMSGSMIWGEDEECTVYRSVAKVELILADDLKQAMQSELRWGMQNFPTSGNIYSASGSACIPSSGLSYYNGVFQGIYPAGTSDEVTAVYVPEYNSSVSAKGNVISDTEFNSERVCLTVRTGNSSSDYRYYRIDLFDRENNIFFDIGRNCNFKVTITKIYSEGYLSLAEALSNHASNLEYYIAIDEQTTSITSSNGQYALQISHDEVHIFDDTTIAHDLFKVGYALASGVRLGETTTNSITASSGLTLSTPAQKVTETMQSVNAKFNSGQTQGTITVRLGNLVKIVKVRIGGQLSSGGGSTTVNYLNQADSQGILWLEKDNEYSLTEDGTEYTLQYRKNDKAVVRRFHVNIFRKYDDGSAGMVKIVGKQAAGS